MSKQFELKQYAYVSGLKSRALSVLIYLIDRSNINLMTNKQKNLHVSSNFSACLSLDLYGISMIDRPFITLYSINKA